MTKIRDIYEALNAIAPFETAMQGDNVGLLIGSLDTAVTRCLLTLDVTTAVCTEAAEQSVQLILTHHPTIFAPIKHIPTNSIPYRLIQANIALLAAHTNFDRAPKGLNAHFADFLELENRVILDGTDGCCILGSLPEPMANGCILARLLKERMHLPALRFFDGKKPIRKVGVTCGGGGDFAEIARKSGADAFVTGEAKHHHLVDAQNFGMTLIEAGHFETEQYFSKLVLDLLAPLFPDVEFIPTKHIESPMKTLR